MKEKPRKMKSGGVDIPVVMTWIGKPELCLTKEEAARRRPRSRFSVPFTYEKIKVSPRHSLKAKAVDARAERDEPAQTDQKPRRRDSDTPRAE